VQAHDRNTDRGLPAELAALLERHLDPEVEPTATIRSVSGEWFPFLVAWDEQCAAAHAGDIFPSEGENHLWRAAWHADGRSNHAQAGVYAVLRVQYRRAVDELDGTACAAAVLSFSAICRRTSSSATMFGRTGRPRVQRWTGDDSSARSDSLPIVRGQAQSGNVACMAP
jgi:hypothetical protein